MRRVEVTIDGVTYPCVLTMGAMARFEELRGKSVSAMDEGSATDSLTYLHCCLKAGCEREGRPFDMSVMQMSDALDPIEFRDIIQQMMDAASSGEKKSPTKRTSR